MGKPIDDGGCVAYKHVQLMAFSSVLEPDGVNDVTIKVYVYCILPGLKEVISPSSNGLGLQLKFRDRSRFAIPLSPPPSTGVRVEMCYTTNTHNNRMWCVNISYIE